MRGRKGERERERKGREGERKGREGGNSNHLAIIRRGNYVVYYVCVFGLTVSVSPHLKQQ